MLCCQAPHCKSQRTADVSVLAPGEDSEELGLPVTPVTLAPPPSLRGQSVTAVPTTLPRQGAYLGSGPGAPNHNAPPARRLVPERQAVPDLDVLLQDEAAAEGAFSFCAIPGGRGAVGAQGTARRPRPAAPGDDDC